MRCVCCNTNLNDFESTARHAESGVHLDTCRKCLKGLGIPVLGRPDLVADESPPPDWFDVGEPFLEPIDRPFEDD